MKIELELEPTECLAILEILHCAAEKYRATTGRGARGTLALYEKLREAFFGLDGAGQEICRLRARIEELEYHLGEKR